MRIKIILGLTTLLAISFISGFAQDEPRTVDTSMGLAIQKYLEGDLKQTITYLDEVLTQKPDYARASDLMEKAVSRLADNIKTAKTFKSDMIFMEMGQKHLPESAVIKTKIKELKAMMEPEESKVKEARPQMEQAELPKIEDVPQKEKKAAITEVAKIPAEKVAVQQENEYEEKLKQMTRQIRNLEKKLVDEKAKNNNNIQVVQIKEEISALSKKLFDLKEAPKNNSGPSVGIVLIMVILGLAGIGLVFTTLKTENMKLIKNITGERRAVEELKTTYNKDTELLARKLSEYGRSSQRAGELEKNWEKVLGILEKLTQGGSMHKVVLKDSPDGRKAVTGVDPRVRARADSVEVIAEIFKDSHKAPQMLAPFLDDKDNRTKANAAVAYYRYDPEKSMAVLGEMAVSQDKWMRLSAAWALGQIGDSLTSKILEKLLDDPDVQVKSKARASLEKILGNKEEEKS